MISTRHLFIFFLLAAHALMSMEKKESFSLQDRSLLAFLKSGHVQPQDLLSDNLDECREYNIVATFLAQKDFRRLDMLLDMCKSSPEYQKYAFLLKCTALENEKNILHHIIEFMDTDHFLSYLKCVDVVLYLHPELVTTPDKDLRFPMSYVTKIPKTSVEYDILKNMIYNYDKTTSMLKSTFWFLIVHKQFTQAQDVLKKYSQDKKKNPFLGDTIGTGSKQSYAHCIVSCMDCDNYVMYFDILNTLLKYHSHLAYQPDGFGLLPYEYVNSNNSLEQQLTDEQKECLRNLLEKTYGKPFFKK